MEEKLTMIEKNQTWNLVKKAPRKKSHWRMELNGFPEKIQSNPEGLVKKWKSRLVLKGYAQVWGVHLLKTFDPVARKDSIRMLLAIAIQKG